MVCIAAFIVLILISVPALVLNLIGKRNKRVEKFVRPYFTMFKKAWYCVGRRVSFRKCDSNFKSEIKNSVLSKLVIKHHKWVRPVSVAIEVAAVLIVAVAIWSLAEVVKSGLSLYVYGTCNVAKPEACVLGDGEVCSTDAGEERNAFIGWFTEWGDVVSAIPARIKTWDATEYIPDNANFYKYTTENPAALDIFDPGCVNCLKSFNNQLASDFFDKYNVALLPYSIKDHSSADGYKFPNSYLISSYIEAVRDFKTDEVPAPEWLIVQKLFTESAPDLDVKLSYQQAFNGLAGLAGTPYSTEKARSTLHAWLSEFGYSEDIIAQIAARADSAEVSSRLDQNRQIVDEKIQTKGIPTTIYDGHRHIGVLHFDK
ncbi:MAG: hypothetical protein LBK50_03795 [Candidatus Nomurabacteria bacterium]|jgi:hypothetical protein|nr:hypothetical protein [Candidatus Nomurabacteria bacterium]